MKHRRRFTRLEAVLFSVFAVGYIGGVVSAIAAGWLRP